MPTRWRCPKCGSELSFSFSPLPPYYPESMVVGTSPHLKEPCYQYCGRHIPMARMEIV